MYMFNSEYIVNVHTFLGNIIIQHVVLSDVHDCVKLDSKYFIGMPLGVRLIRV